MKTTMTLKKIADIHKATGQLLSSSGLTKPAPTLDQYHALRAALLTVLDCVDYTAGACLQNEMVSAVLPKQVIEHAREALAKGAK